MILTTNARGATSTAPTVAPFAFESLPAVSRHELDAAKKLRDATDHLVRKDAIGRALADLTGETISIALRRTRFMDPAHIPSSAIGVAFSIADAPTMAHAILVDAEPALAATLITRALKQRAPRVVDGSQPATPEIAGALAAILHSALRRAHAGVPLRVVAAGPAQPLARDLAASSHPATNAAARSIVTAWLTVFVGEDAFDARVSVRLVDWPTGASPRAQPRLTEEDLLVLDDAPLALPLVATSCLVTRMELMALRSGDALVFPGFPLSCRGTETGKASILTGPVTLIAPGSERGLGAHLAEDGRLVVRTNALEHHPLSSDRDGREGRTEETMSTKGESKNMGPGDAMTNTATLEVIEDAPVVVRVELGVVEMKAREWAALGTGDVITLGRRLGDPATLRVGGVDVAYGELVQVDGEYGVRILGRPVGHR